MCAYMYDTEQSDRKFKFCKHQNESHFAKLMLAKVICLTVRSKMSLQMSTYTVKTILRG